ncbi:hypothetical protein DJ568_04995 [Mucilaginibacter hurinus]|uniref:Uncharacterized protein n=1 Tax=Mucilaginibacter hurinus TaxID=2201324 RepID=A0A367GRL4_9SPHI|nr:hypothetical protein [Mucilaginibacter hurinus]RCH56104.1 hypothetical protein DJ568_04995 [Mucilaginibacter hurinus]
MIFPKVRSAVDAALQAYSKYSGFNAVELGKEFHEVISSDKDFLNKVELLDAVFDNNPQVEVLREVFFDLLLINFFSADVKKLEEDYLDTPEWEAIEEETIDRGTELLNLLLYLNECEDEGIEPELEDFLKEFLLVDEDEFQDEYRIYEPIISNQVLAEGSLVDISGVAATLPDDAELKELFYPIMAYFRNTKPAANAADDVAQHAPDKPFDVAVYEILTNFK